MRRILQDSLPSTLRLRNHASHALKRETEIERRLRRAAGAGRKEREEQAGPAWLAERDSDPISKPGKMNMKREGWGKCRISEYSEAGRSQTGLQQQTAATASTSGLSKVPHCSYERKLEPNILGSSLPELVVLSETPSSAWEG